MSDDTLFFLCIVVPFAIFVVADVAVIVTAIRIIRKQRKLFLNDSIKINIEVKNRTDDGNTEQKQ